MMRNNNRACRILLAGALATATSEAFAPLKSSRFISTSNPSLESADTRLSYIINHPTVIDIPTASPRVLFSVEDLDAEVDAFADPNDKRYSASDWYHNMVSLPNSAILREIKGPVGWIAAWSTLVSVVYKVCHMKGLGHIADKMCLGPTPHSLISSVIGLLLVFRTNSAYQRFKEGRTTWEQLLNTCRDITRMTSVYEREVGLERKQRIQRLLAAFPYLLHHHIQPRCLDRHSQCGNSIIDTPHALRLNEPRAVLSMQSGCPKSQVQKFAAHECWVDKRSLPWCLLPDSILRKVAQSHNRPLWATDRLAMEFTEIPYCMNWTSRERLELLKTASKLTECIGHCERLHQTAVPLNYARHALRSLTIWSFTLPFGMVDKLGLMTGPTVGVVAWLMFGVYQIGHTIEDPFQGSLRLSDMCNSIYRDVMYGDRNEAGMRRESAFRKDDEKDTDWDSVGDAFGLGWTVKAKNSMERYTEQLVLNLPTSSLTPANSSFASRVLDVDPLL